MISIKALSESNLRDSQDLVERIFPREHAGKMLAASLNIEQYRDYLDGIKVSWLEYYVATDDDGNIIGTSGLYTKNPAENSVVWLGWFCVSEEYRRKGVGKKLLDYSISKAVKKGYNTMKIYSDAGVKGEAARGFYTDYGFTQTVEANASFYWEKALV